MNPKILSILMLTAVTSAIALVLVFMAQQPPVKDTVPTHDEWCASIWRFATDRDNFPQESDKLCVEVHNKMDRDMINKGPQF